MVLPGRSLMYATSYATSGMGRFLQHDVLRCQVMYKGVGMRGFRLPGLGERLSEVLRSAGYVKPDGKLDLMRFCQERGFQYIYVERWAKGRNTPTIESIRQLARALDVDPAWLMLGDRPMRREPVTAPAR